MPTKCWLPFGASCPASIHVLYKFPLIFQWASPCIQPSSGLSLLVVFGHHWPWAPLASTVSPHALAQRPNLFPAPCIYFSARSASGLGSRHRSSLWSPRSVSLNDGVCSPVAPPFAPCFAASHGRSSLYINASSENRLGLIDRISGDLLDTKAAVSQSQMVMIHQGKLA